MPLPAPACARTDSHQRNIAVRAYTRADGLFDIEGHLTDAWPEPIPRAGSLLPAGEPMHAMWVRLTVDRTATIVAADVVTDAGPYDAFCADGNADYGQLVGVQIMRGYKDTVRRLFGRTAGCTHINELLGAMGSAAIQALWPVLNADPDRQPAAIGGCRALKPEGEPVRLHFPRWHVKPAT